MRKLLIASLVLNVALISAGGFLVHRLGGISYLMLRATEGMSGAAFGRLEHLAAIDQQAAPGGIYFVGDSLTESAEWHEILGVRNRGIAGSDSGRLAKRLEPIIATRPKAIFLMLGANDLPAGRDTAAGIAKAIEQIKRGSPETLVYVQSILPVNNETRRTGRNNNAIVAMNKRLAQLPAQYIDLHQHFADESGNLKRELSLDGLHLSGEGYALWLKLIRPYIHH
jgi:lysophospholipase L1-like esterase